MISDYISAICAFRMMKENLLYVGILTQVNLDPRTKKFRELMSVCREYDLCMFGVEFMPNDTFTFVTKGGTTWIGDLIVSNSIKDYM